MLFFIKFTSICKFNSKTFLTTKTSWSFEAKRVDASLASVRPPGASVWAVTQAIWVPWIERKSCQPTTPPQDSTALLAFSAVTAALLRKFPSIDLNPIKFSPTFVSILTSFFFPFDSYIISTFKFPSKCYSHCFK